MANMIKKYEVKARENKVAPKQVKQEANYVRNSLEGPGQWHRQSNVVMNPFHQGKENCIKEKENFIKEPMAL